MRRDGRDPRRDLQQRGADEFVGGIWCSKGVGVDLVSDSAGSRSSGEVRALQSALEV